MFVLVYSLTLVGLALASQIAIWRIRLPLHQTKAILLIFVAVFFIGAGCATTGVTPRLSPAQIAHVAVFHLSAALAYACLYSAIEAESPTIALVVFTSSKGERGAQRAEYREFLNEDSIVGSRIRAMIRDGLVIQGENGYALTARGARLARLFDLASRIFNLSGTG